MVIVIHRVTDCERIAIYKFDFAISGVSLSQSASTFCFQTGNQGFLSSAALLAGRTFT